MSGVQSGIRTPGVYTAVNINTQRTGLIPNEQKVLFVTTDPKELDQPIAIYDTSDADEKIGTDSKVTRMIKAAVKTNRLVDAYAMPIIIDKTVPATPVADLDATLEV